MTEPTPNFHRKGHGVDPITSGTTAEAIIALLRDGEEWRPAVVWRTLRRSRRKLTYNAVKKAMARLAERGVLVRVRRGWYRLKGSRPTHGVAEPSPFSSRQAGPGASPTANLTRDLRYQGVSNATDPSGLLPQEPPRVHDLWLQAKIPPDIPIRPIDWGVRASFTEIRFTIGVKRRKLTIVVANDSGLDYDGLSLALELARREVESRLGWWPDPDELKVLNAHFNHDLVGLDLDGFKSMTLRSFDGWLARMYQKRPGVTRLEVQPPSGDLRATQIMAVLQGAVTGAQALTFMASLTNSIQQLLREQRQLIEQNKQFLRFQRAVLSRLGVSS